jgi:hypothetical protein
MPGWGVWSTKLSAKSSSKTSKALHLLGIPPDYGDGCLALFGVRHFSLSRFVSGKPDQKVTTYLPVTCFVVKSK